MGKKSTLPAVPDSAEHAAGGPSSLENRVAGRLKMQRTIRVRPSIPGSKVAEEILDTLNVSRNGLYFGTASGSYYEGMRLFVTYPYSSVPGAINRDYVAKVMRVDRLPNGLYGVAIQFSSTIYLEMNTGRGRG
jgi:hypothetical protein